VSAPIFLDSFAALLPEGILRSGACTPWNTGQKGPDDVLREQILDKPYPGFGKLHLADRLAFAAVAMLFSNYSPSSGDKNGIILATPAGSFSTDMHYLESLAETHPSPALFSATLPSSAIADAAIYFGLKGPNRVIAGDETSGLCAFEQALLLLQKNKAESMVVISLFAIEASHKACGLLGRFADAKNRAYAFLLTRNKNPNGLGFRLDANFVIPEKTLPVDARESYFHDMARMLMQRKNGRVSFGSGDYCGHISFEKDL
jgi:Beta-ketoacyl synthase, N-terminal domain